MDNEPPTQLRSPESPATPDALGIKITDVDRSLHDYIKTHKRRQIVILIPVFFILLVLSLYATVHIGTSGLFLFILPASALYTAYTKLRFEFEGAFLEDFARANGYNFDKTGDVERLHASIFKLTEVIVSDVVSGLYAGSDMRLFVADAREGKGRNRQRFFMSVMQIHLSGTLPHIFMCNKHIDDWGTISTHFPYQNTIALEGDFGNYFTLYANDADRDDALEVFAPGLMAFMEDESRQFSVEFDRDYMHIYVNGLITTDAQVTNLYDVTRKLIDRIEPIAHRLLVVDQLDADSE